RFGGTPLSATVSHHGHGDARTGEAGLGYARTGGFMVDPFDAVGVIDQDNPGAVGFDFSFGGEAVAGDDDFVAPLGQVGGSAVDTDDSGMSEALDEVGGKATAVGDVVQIDPLIGGEALRFHQLRVHG